MHPLHSSTPVVTTLIFQCAEKVAVDWIAWLPSYQFTKTSLSLLVLAYLEQIPSERIQIKNTLFYPMLGVTILLLILALLLLRAHHRAQKANRQLAELNEEIKQKNTALKERNEEIKVQHQAIHQQKQSLEEMNEVKDKMFSIIAHDLRSPLNTLQGVLRLLHLEALSPDELKMLLPDLSRKMDMSISLLDNLLHWARAQMHGLRVDSSTFPLERVLVETIGHMDQLAEQKNIRIRYNTGYSLMVHADLEMVRLVMRNLISNAIKFSFPDSQVQINIFQKNQKAVVSVVDYGVGMEKDIQQDIFSQSGYTTIGTAHEKGTGLGLGLCQEFVRHNQGDIWVESHPGEGTTFTFTLPIATQAVNQPAPVLQPEWQNK